MPDEMTEEVTEQTADAIYEQGEESPSDTEQKAREAGWRPQEEWQGDTAGWMDAEEFIARNDRLQDRADGVAKAEIGRLTKQVGELNSTIETFAEHHRKVEERAYERARTELKAKQREAVAEGDEAAFDAAAGEIDNLEAEAKAAAKEGPTADKAAPPDPEFTAWLAVNAWYDPKSDAFNPEMSAFAERIAPTMQRTGLSGRAYYDRIAEEVKKKSADSEPPRRRAAAVEAGGGERFNGKGPTYRDLPAEAKAACDDFVKQGLLTKDQYLKDYFE